MKKPSPLIARSDALPVPSSAPCENMVCTLPMRLPAPARSFATTPPRTSEKLAREERKPTVLTFAMLSLMTPIASEWLPRPAAPVYMVDWIDMMCLRVRRSAAERGGLVLRLAVERSGGSRGGGHVADRQDVGRAHAPGSDE